MSSNGIYTTNSNGEIVITGLTGTVVVTEEKAPDGYILDPNSRTQTVTVNTDDTQTLVFYDTPIGGLIITKSDEETGARISGVQFEVQKMNGEIIGQYATDRNGTTTANVANGANGSNGASGSDGFSPTVTVNTIAGGHSVSVTDANGAHSFNVLDGSDYVLTSQDKSDIAALVAAMFTAGDGQSY